MRPVLTALLLLISSVCTAQSLGAGKLDLGGVAGEPEFLPVEEAYQLDVEIAGDREVRLYWQIAPDYYLY